MLSKASHTLHKYKTAVLLTKNNYIARQVEEITYLVIEQEGRHVGGEYDSVDDENEDEPVPDGSYGAVVFERILVHSF